MIDQFYDIPGFDGRYQINKNGNIRRTDHYVANRWGYQSLLKGRMLTPNLHIDGYYTIRFRKNGKGLSLLVHRLMAITFLDNPENKRTVNHKNGIKTDNSIENLEWATDSENSKHAYRLGLKKAKRGESNPMYQRTGKLSPHYGKSRGLNYAAKLVLNTQMGIFYDCVQDAADAIGMSVNVLRQRLNGALKNNTSLIYC